MKYMLLSALLVFSNMAFAAQTRAVSSSELTYILGEMTGGQIQTGNCRVRLTSSTGNGARDQIIIEDLSQSSPKNNMIIVSLNESNVQSMNIGGRSESAGFALSVSDDSKSYSYYGVTLKDLSSRSPSTKHITKFNISLVLTGTTASSLKIQKIQATQSTELNSVIDDIFDLFSGSSNKSKGNVSVDASVSCENQL